MSMAAFVVAFVAAGWRPGDAVPDGTPLAAASGAAFIAVVLGQVANAFACRSSTRWPGAAGLDDEPAAAPGGRRRAGVLARRPARPADRATSWARRTPRRRLVRGR